MKQACGHGVYRTQYSVCMVTNCTHEDSDTETTVLLNGCDDAHDAVTGHGKVRGAWWFTGRCTVRRACLSTSGSQGRRMMEPGETNDGRAAGSTDRSIVVLPLAFL